MAMWAVFCSGLMAGDETGGVYLPVGWHGAGAHSDRMCGQRVVTRWRMTGRFG